MNKPRFDRILPLISLVVLGLMIVFLLDSNPTNPLVARISDDLPVISVAWLIIAILVIVISAGADILARQHPQLEHSTLLRLPRPFKSYEIAPLFWIMPSMVVISAYSFFRLFRGTLEGTAFILVLVSSGILLTGTLVAQHYDLDRNPEIREKARMGLQIIAYLIMFGLFCAITYTRYRALISAALTGLVSVPMAYRLLARSVNDHRRPLSIALGVVGVLLAETAIILTYWPAPFMISGTCLLVLFYVMVGTLQHAQSGTLTQRVGWELAGLGTMVLAVLAVTTLW